MPCFWGFMSPHFGGQILKLDAQFAAGEKLLSTIVLSVVVVLLTLAVKWWAGIALVKAAALLVGLEGTVLLASAISPPHGDMEETPRGLLKKLAWPFIEGRRLAYPIRYNAVFFYGGLAFLAISFVLSAI
jgi:hypothetical protein